MANMRRKDGGRLTEVVDEDEAEDGAAGSAILGVDAVERAADGPSTAAEGTSPSAAEHPATPVREWGMYTKVTSMPLMHQRKSGRRPNLSHSMAAPTAVAMLTICRGR